ncbi:hypothetical protein AB0J84_02715 [Micromonospora arborensis]|uniref:hypothetical protein n=1 Tax=Micromonospora arborensis TaxID=2116518 RepID=UPI003424B060
MRVTAHLAEAVLPIAVTDAIDRSGTGFNHRRAEGLPLARQSDSLSGMGIDDDRRQAATGGSPAGSGGTSSQPPAPVLIAALLVAAGALVPIGLLVLVLTEFEGGNLVPALLLALVGVAVCASVGYGLWRGWRGSRIVAMVLGGLLLLSGLNSFGSSDFGLLPMAYGALLVLLLLVPASARAWFRPS